LYDPTFGLIALNSEKGIVLGVEASGELSGVKAEAFVKGHATEDNGGVEVGLKHKSVIPEPTEKYLEEMG